MLTVEDVRNKQIRNVKRSILIVVLIVIGCWIIATIGVYYDPEMHQFLKELIRDKSLNTYLNNVLDSSPLYGSLYMFPFCLQWPIIIFIIPLSNLKAIHVRNTDKKPFLYRRGKRDLVAYDKSEKVRIAFVLGPNLNGDRVTDGNGGEYYRVGSNEYYQRMRR